MIIELERPKQNGVFTQQAQACLADIESGKMNSNNDRHLKPELETSIMIPNIKRWPDLNS